MPLRSTEILFVDDQTVICPNCARERPRGDAVCPHCGTQEMLARAAIHTSTFRISSVMLLTTLIAVCLALGRFSPFLGILLSCLLAFATLRTILLVRHRKRFKYPTSPRDVMRLFGMSVVGIIVACLAFAVVWVVLAFVTIAFFGRSAGESLGFIIAAILMIVASEVGAVVLVAWRQEGRRMLLIGIVVASIAAFAAFEIAGGVGSGVAAGIVLTILLNIGVIALALACRPGGASRAKGWIVGCSVGLSSAGGLGMLFATSRTGEMLGTAFVGACYLVWPILVGILVLEGMWSWDDAFPPVATRHPAVMTERLPSMAVDDEGIAFADEPVADDVGADVGAEQPDSTSDDGS